MSQALLLTASDLSPLRDDPACMDGALAAVEAAIVAQYAGRMREGHLLDRTPGEFEGIRLSLLAGDDSPSGMRVFGNPPHTRAFLLFDGTTRALLAHMDYGVLNSLHVGATAGVAARYLAPRGARSMGLLGSGWQAFPQVTALHSALPTLGRIRVFSPTPAHRAAFAETTAARIGLAVEAVASVEDALRDAEVVGDAIPRRHEAERVIYQLEGGTVQDLFVATWGYEWARARGLGQPFDLSA
jgi:alanine dehydrogenase